MIAKTLIVGEEESFFLANWSTKGSTELVLFQWLNGGGGKAGGIERIVRTNSQTVPWYELEPERVTMLVVDPRLLPNSALALWVRILNSEIASIGGLSTKPPSTPLKLLAPSIRKLFDSGRCPFTA
jgi:hypothetical protein